MRKDINPSFLKNLKGYEPISELLCGMLEENPQKRWDFNDILNFYQMKEKDPQFRQLIPTDEAEFVHRYQEKFKDRNIKILQKI